MNIERSRGILFMLFEPVIICPRQKTKLGTFGKSKYVIRIAMSRSIFNIQFITKIQLPEILDLLVQFGTQLTWILQQVWRTRAIVITTDKTEIRIDHRHIVFPVIRTGQSQILRSPFRRILILFVSILLQNILRNFQNTLEFVTHIVYTHVHIIAENEFQFFATHAVHYRRIIHQSAQLCKARHVKPGFLKYGIHRTVSYDIHSVSTAKAELHIVGAPSSKNFSVDIAKESPWRIHRIR